MSNGESRAIVERLFQELDGGNLDVLDNHPGLQLFRPSIKQSVIGAQSGTLQRHVTEVIAEGDWVAVRMVYGGLAAGNGREVLAMYKVRDRSIVRAYGQGGDIRL